MKTIKLSKRKIEDDSLQEEKPKKISDMKKEIEEKLDIEYSHGNTKDGERKQTDLDSQSKSDLLKTDDELIEEKIEEIHHSKMYVNHKDPEEKALEQEEYLEEKKYKKHKISKISKILLPIILLLFSLTIAVGAAIYESDPNYKIFQTLGIAKSVDNKLKCNHEGKEYQDNETFKIAETCMICTCSGGGVNCDEDICENTDTPEEELIENEVTAVSKQTSIEIKSATKFQEDYVYIAVLDTKPILLYSSNTCNFKSEGKTFYKYAKYLNNETFFDDKCISTEKLSDIYELLNFNDLSQVIINSYFYDTQNNIIYTSLIDTYTTINKGEGEVKEVSNIDSYIYKFDLKNNLSTLLWQQKSSKESTNIKYAYLSDKSNSDKLLFSLVECSDCEIDEPSEIYMIDLITNEIYTLGRIYVKTVDKNNVVTYQKYVDKFYYPIDNLDAKNFYCKNNPDYWCGDGQSVWKLYEKIYTKSFD